MIKLGWSVCICLTQLYDGRDMYRIDYIKNNYMFRQFALAIFRLINVINSIRNYHRQIHKFQSSIIIKTKGMTNFMIRKRFLWRLHVGFSKSVLSLFCISLVHCNNAKKKPPERLRYHVKNMKVKCTLVQALKFCRGLRPIGGIEVYLHSFFTTALEGGEGSASRHGRNLRPGKTRYPFYKRLGGPQGRCGRAVNLVPTGIRSPDRAARSQSLYRLNYRAHKLSFITC